MGRSLEQSATNRKSGKDLGQSQPKTVGSSDPTSTLPLVVVDRSARAVEVPMWVRIPLYVRLMALTVIVIVSVMLGGLIGLYRQPPGLQWAMETIGLEPGAGTDNPIAVSLETAATGGSGARGFGSVVAPTVVGLGKLLPVGEVMTVAPPSGVRDARISKLLVSEGDRIAANSLIAVLDSESRLQAALASARATVALRHAGVEQARTAARASLGEAQATLSRAESAARRAELDFDRTNTLYAKNIVAKASYDQKLATLEQAQKEVEQARATLSRFNTDNLDIQTDVVFALRQLDAARADQVRAEADLEQAYIRAPVTGTVLDVKIQPGEKLDSDGVADLGQIDNMTAKVEVYQSLVGRIEIGDAVELTADALAEKLKGEVTRIGAQVKRQTVLASDPSANTDAKIVEVLVALDEGSSKRASRYTNLQVEANFKVSDRTASAK